MARKITFLIVLLSFCFACKPELTSPDKAYKNQQWTFSLDNPVGKRFSRLPLKVGDQASFRTDSVQLSNQLTGWNSTLKIVEDPSSLDSNQMAVTVTAIDDRLEFHLYLQDSLLKSAVFEPSDSSRLAVGADRYLGKTFLFSDEEKGDGRIYFGNDPQLKFTREVKDYYVISYGDLKKPVSVARKKGSSNPLSLFTAFSPTPFRGSLLVQFGGGKGSAFGDRPFQLIQKKDGVLLANYIVEKNGVYTEKNVNLAPLPPTVPENVSLETLCQRLNQGRVMVDKSYPDPDTSRVAFSYKEDFLKRGIFYEELSGLEINFNPDGEYFLFIGDRLVEHYNWRLSPDRNYLIILGKDGSCYKHLPILSYSDELIEFRLPLNITTREPKGVELISYVKVDALIRITN